MSLNNSFTAIEVQNLTKIYRLYAKPFNRLKEIILQRPYHKEFIALYNISFLLYKGQTLGIIGENGAGKSTLLKILSKTLSPTCGHVNINGRFSSLLELGSGFHPEFTGIENIHFYSALFGMDKNTLKKKMNDILAFAEIGDYVNYPIKTYSSGMFVRLAFSVATAIDPDILIIDEALSVGDQYFQKKCLEKMAEFKKKGKTIVFCSHDMYQIKTFCDTTIWLQQGQIKRMGTTDEVINEYVNSQIGKSSKYKEQAVYASNTENEIINNGNLLYVNELQAYQPSKRDITITFKVYCNSPFYAHFGWAILRHDHLQISFDTTKMKNMEPVLLSRTNNVTIEVKNLNIVNGSYLLYIGVFDKEAYKPIIVESILFEIKTDTEILNSLCYFESKFTINPELSFSKYF